MKQINGTKQRNEGEEKCKYILPHPIIELTYSTTGPE